MMLNISGGVVVNNVEYLDEEIALLVGYKIDGWKFAGSLFEDECDIVVNDMIFKGENALKNALSYIKGWNAGA